MFVICLGEWAQKAVYSTRGASQRGLYIWKRPAGHWSSTPVFFQSFSYQTRRGMCLVYGRQMWYSNLDYPCNFVYCLFFRGNASLPSSFPGMKASFEWFMKLLRTSCSSSQSSILYAHDLSFIMLKAAHNNVMVYVAHSFIEIFWHLTAQMQLYTVQLLLVYRFYLMLM